MSPLILNQASAQCLWAAAKSSLQEQPSSIGIPDSWLEASKLRWQILQSFSIFAKCTLISANPHSRSISTEHSDTEDPLLFSTAAAAATATPSSSRMSALEWTEHRRTSSESVRGRCWCCSTSIATTWEAWTVVIAKTQKENPHVMGMWGEKEEWGERERRPMKEKTWFRVWWLMSNGVRSRRRKSGGCPLFQRLCWGVSGDVQQKTELLQRGRRRRKILETIFGLHNAESIIQLLLFPFLFSSLKKKK